MIFFVCFLYGRDHGIWIWNESYISRTRNGDIMLDNNCMWQEFSSQINFKALPIPFQPPLKKSPHHITLPTQNLSLQPYKNKFIYLEKIR